ncbi:hypothetical protein MY1884_009576 [Beauveria asiatica]
MSSDKGRAFDVDTSGQGADAKHSGSGIPGQVGNTEGGHGSAAGTFKATGKGGEAIANPSGTAKGGDGKGGSFTLD